MELFGRQGGVGAARMGGIGFRRGGAADEFATFEVMRRTIQYEIDWSHHASVRRHLQTTERGSFWVAEETPRFGSPKIVGYARSIVRARVWCLTEFFVLPEYHRRGIGRALLSRCLEDGADAGVDTWFILASQHVGADSLYIRLAGCLPRLPMLLLVGPSETLRVSEETAATILDARRTPSEAQEETGERPQQRPSGSETLLRAYPVALTPKIQAEIDALDREMVGFARPQEHTHWAAEMGGANGASRLFRRVEGAGGSHGSGALEGYAYFGAYSSGPALMREPADLPRALAHVATLHGALTPTTGLFGRTVSLEQYLAVAGVNGVTLNWLLSCGWQIVFQYLFMSSRPLGQLDRYVCHNPLYLL